VILESAVGIFGGHVHALSFHVVLPPVVSAPQAVFFIASEEKIGTAVGAEAADQPQSSIAVAERH
jgi:hypothetical protein